MQRFMVWVQHEEEWKKFGEYDAATGYDAIRMARLEETRLQLMFVREDVSTVNMDYEQAEY